MESHKGGRKDTPRRKNKHKTQNKKRKIKKLTDRKKESPGLPKRGEVSKNTTSSGRNGSRDRS